MSKKFRLMLILALMSPATIFAGEAGKATLEGAVRVRNTSSFDSDNEYKANYTSIERGYLTVKYNVSKNIATKLTLDAISNADGVDGASVRIKSAYADFNVLGPVGITAGLATNYFGMTRDISSSFIYYKAGAEKWFSNPSTDYGVTLRGDFLDDKLEAQIQATNGSGYKKIAKDKGTKAPDFIANLRVKPVKPFMVGLSLKYDKLDEADNNNVLLAPHLKISSDYIDIPVETVVNMGDETTFDGKKIALYVQPEIKLKKLIKIPLSIGGGFGMLTNETEEENASVAMGGLKFDPVKNIKLQAAYVNEMTNRETTSSKLMFQMEYKFKAKLN